MPSGGHARSGPAPNPDALRRERESGQWLILPAEGRNGPVPEWPLDGQTEREVTLWAQMWGKPQALLWERNGQEFEVATFVRRFAEAEQPGSPIASGTLVRQLMDSLLLTIPAMRTARVQIAASPEQETAAAAEPKRKRSSSKARLTVVRDDGDEAGA